MPSEVFVQGCGVAATVLLCGMLLPQVWQLFRTKRSEELSHVFLGLMNFGLVMLTIYNVFLELWVFFVAGVLQLVLGAVTQGGKVWADRYQRRLRAKAGNAQLTRALSLRSGAKMELTKFAAGSSAPFPLLRPSPTHAAQHLLLDVRLPPAAAPPAAAAGTGAGAAATAGTCSGADEPVGLPAMAELWQAALAGAGLALQRGQRLGAHGPVPSNSSGKGSWHESDPEGQQDAESVLLACQDGYAVLVWHASAGSLSVDCLAVAAQAMHGMAAAAEAFCATLAERYPGCKVAASSLGRLPLLPSA